MVQDVNAIIEKRRNMFISARRDVEVWVETFFKELDRVDAKLLDGIELPTGRTAKELFPSLYVEPFNEEQYEMEYSTFNAFYEQIMSVAERLNNKALEVLNQ